MRTMKVITLYEPYATLVVHGKKKIETRGWRTHHRGHLLIHSAKKFPKWCREKCFEKPFSDALNECGITRTMDFKRGHIIGEVDITNCLQIVDLITCGEYDTHMLPPPEPERSLGDYSCYRWAWILENSDVFQNPIEARGRQGIWSWEGEYSCSH